QTGIGSLTDMLAPPMSIEQGGIPLGSRELQQAAIANIKTIARVLGHGAEVVRLEEGSHETVSLKSGPPVGLSDNPLLSNPFAFDQWIHGRSTGFEFLAQAWNALDGSGWQATPAPPRVMRLYSLPDDIRMRPHGRDKRDRDFWTVQIILEKMRGQP